MSTVHPVKCNKKFNIQKDPDFMKSFQLDRVARKASIDFSDEFFKPNMTFKIVNVCEQNVVSHVKISPDAANDLVNHVT